MADAKIDMALDDIIKSNRGGRGNRRGGRGGGLQRQQRGGNNQRGNSRGRINKSNNNRGRGGGGGGQNRNSFNQRNSNRSNNYRPQRGNRKSFPGYPRRNNNNTNAGDKPTATYNPLSREADSSTAKQQQQQQTTTTTTPRRQQGSVFNKIRKTPNAAANGNVSALRRRMVAAQRALNRATKTLAAMPRIRQQRQRVLQQPQKLRNIITRNRVSGGAVRKRLGTGARNMGGRGGARGRGRRMFV